MLPTFLESLKDEPDHEILIDGLDAFSNVSLNDYIVFMNPVLEAYWRQCFE